MEDRYQIIHSECLAALKQMQDNSVDSIVTDPPYGISFMGKKWDYDVPSQEIWEECLRVLKPGGHLLSFAGTRTQHRMAVRIEDAGFEIRDMIAWVYGSGFPKSHNLKDEWQGWGTALKPALEPITVARKPLIGTVAENVLAHGTGAINVDGCRVHAEDAQAGRKRHGGGIAENHTSFILPDSNNESPAGRWPANLIHDGSEEVISCFPEANGQQGAISGKEPSGKTKNTYGEYQGRNPSQPREEADKSAARFFYCAKASKKDRGEGNKHPTVKPTELMRYLCRLVTPTGGTVLDPFMGSGSTGKAAMLEGFKFIGIDMQEDYCKIAEERIKAVLQGD